MLVLQNEFQGATFHDKSYHFENVHAVYKVDELNPWERNENTVDVGL